MKHEYVKEHKIVRTESGDMVVSRYSILTTTRVCYRVYEPGSFTRSHSTITHFDGLSGWYGELVTRELPPEIEALPAGNARSEACHNYWHATRDHLTARQHKNGHLWRYAGNPYQQRLERARNPLRNLGA